MRIVRSAIAICLAVILAAPVAGAQQTHVIGKAALDKAVQDRAAQDRDDREAIRSLLRRAEVRDIAAQAGLSMEKAERAVAMLDGEELRQASAQAREVQNNLSGGATVVITTTTIIIVLLLIIILVLVAD